MYRVKNREEFRMIYRFLVLVSFKIVVILFIEIEIGRGKKRR